MADCVEACGQRWDLADCDEACGQRWDLAEDRVATTEYMNFRVKRFGLGIYRNIVL